MKFFSLIFKLIKNIFKFIFKISLFFNTVIFTAIIVLVIALMASTLVKEKEKIISSSSILKINLDGEITEGINFSVLDSELKTSFWQVAKAIKIATVDPKIEAIYLDLSNFDYISIATANELSNNLKLFKNTGKKIYLYAPNFTATSYLIASLANEIWLDSYGSVALNGITISHLYLKNALDKFKITPYVVRAGSHKSAVEPFIANEMSAEVKESSGNYINDVWSVLLTRMATNRNLSYDDMNNFAKMRLDNLRAYNGDGAKLALDKNLITNIGTKEDLDSKLMDSYKINKEKLNFAYSDYLKIVNIKQKISPNKVVLLYASGAITQKSRDDNSLISENLVKSLKDLEEDKSVKAVVLRLDSPGGEVFASEQIYRAVASVKKVKPIVISMANMSASGGYWLSMAGNEIFADETTLTGSIGVFSVFFSAHLALKDLGITEQSLSIYEDRNPSLFKEPNSTTLDLMKEEIKFIYNNFLGKLLESGRAVGFDDAISKAEGRIFSGKRAKDLKLVDNIGTVDDAIKRAGELAKLDSYQFIFYHEDTLLKAIEMQMLFKNYILAIPFLSDVKEIKALLSGYVKENKTLMMETNQVIVN